MMKAKRPKRVKKPQKAEDQEQKNVVGEQKSRFSDEPKIMTVAEVRKINEMAKSQKESN